MTHSHATQPIMQAAEREEDLLREQRHHLHETQSRISTIDPITGKDIGNLEGKPSLVVGNLTVYFESEQTRQAYLDKKHQH
ncbi:MAG: hypothetical protein ACYC4K_03730 [Thiobacillus sp.]